MLEYGVRSGDSIRNSGFSSLIISMALSLQCFLLKSQMKPSLAGTVRSNDTPPFIPSLRALLNLALLSALIALTFYTYYYLPGHFWADVLPDQQKLFAFGVGTLLPFLYPKKKRSAYSPMAQLFHRLILNHYHLGKALLKRQIKGIEHPVQADNSRANSHAANITINHLFKPKLVY